MDKFSKYILKIAFFENKDNWETVADFTLIKKGGVLAKDVINYLKNRQKKLKNL